tara:strand:- start:193668 stop:194546 length:879 start_codon:yes stop_codon:yes gene_type:complete
MKTNILITGANGQVGYEFSQLDSAYALHSFSRQELDITDAEQVANRIQQTKADIVINCAAYTAVDKAESHPEQAKAINVAGCENLAQACQQLDIPFIHISTDYVYDGEKTSAYIETDATNPKSVYGQTKLQGESTIQAVGGKHIILRTSWVFGRHGNNFVKTMLRLMAEKTELNIVDDQTGCPTSANSIARTILDMVPTLLDKSFHDWGIYHYSNGPSTSWYQFADAIQATANQLGAELTCQLSPITTAQYPTPAKRPMHSEMSNDKINHIFNIQPTPWQQELTKIIEATYE